MVYTNLAWASRAIHDSKGNTLLRSYDLQLLKKAAIAKCDLDDGVKDGVIGNPLNCSFDPSELLCKRDKAQDCLTPEQVAAAKKIYSGPVTTGGVKLLPGGPFPGSEQANVDWGFAGWDDVYGDQMVSTVTSGFRYLFFMPEPGPTWTLKDFDLDRDYKRLTLVEALYDSSNPDLRKFKAAGGKLIVYQGLNDPAVLPRSTIDYYETVERTMSGREATQSFFRLFALPGMDHCGFGDGAYAVDWLSTLETWVEKGQAPDKLISSHVRLDDIKFPNDFAKLQRRNEFPLDRTIYPPRLPLSEAREIQRVRRFKRRRKLYAGRHERVGELGVPQKKNALGSAWNPDLSSDCRAACDGRRRGAGNPSLYA
jgi:hypothetical protein